MTEPTGSRVTDTVLCVRCRVRYVPTPDEEWALAQAPSIPLWVRTAVRAATAAGWFHRTDGLLLCTAHADLGDGPLPVPAASGA